MAAEFKTTLALLVGIGDTVPVGSVVTIGKPRKEMILANVPCVRVLTVLLCTVDRFNGADKQV